MSIFISYRRDDSAAWAGRLHDHLARFFSRSRVFMDVDGHISAGAEYDRIIRDALERCSALIAVIGPNWLTCAREGVRRLDHPDDWVRREIARALERGVTVIPVRVGGAPLPAEAQLPTDIARLVTSRQAAAIDDARWDDDVARIVEALRRELGDSLGTQSTIDTAAAALTRLAVLIRESPSLARIVGRYSEALTVTVRQITDLDAHKRIHDALHKVEGPAGLGALRSNRSRAQLIACRAIFAGARREIEECLARPAAISDALADEIRIGLDAAARALAGPVDDEASVRRTADSAVAELTSLVGQLPTQLDHAISAAARTLQEHGRLDGLARDLRGHAAQDPAIRAQDLDLLFGGLDDLEVVRGEFMRLVDEHTRLQRIDSFLRELCATPRREKWETVKLLRARLARPLSAPLQTMWDALDAFEADVDRAFETGTESQALASLHQTFVTVFHEVDTNLKNASKHLAAINGPIQQLLIDEQS